MSPEPAKVQVEYINEDKSDKVNSAKWKDAVLLCNWADASGQRSRVGRRRGRAGRARPRPCGARQATRRRLWPCHK